MRRLGIRIANAVLFVVCCFLAASIFNQIGGSLLQPAEAALLPATTDVAARPGTWNERKAILDRNLFGAQLGTEVVAAPEPEEEKLEETKLPLRLLGTAAADDPAFSRVSIEDLRNRRHQSLVVGDPLAGHPGVSVERIERRRVVLKNGARREELRLGDDPPTQVRSPVAAAKPTRQRRTRPRRTMAALRAERNTTKKAEEPTTAGVAESLKQLMESVDAGDPGQRSTARLFSEARIMPAYDGDQMVGVKLSEVKAGSFYEKLGLGEGDVIKQLNGIEINSPAASTQVLSELSEAAAFEIVVVGAGGERSLTIDSDQIAQLE